MRVLDRASRRQVGLFAHDDPVDGGRPLQPCGGVHDVTGDHGFSERRPCAERDNRLARVDGDADLQVTAGELARDVPHHERSAHSSLGVVSVGDRRSKNSHHRVADELLDDSPERLDLAADAVVVRREHCADLLGVEPLGPGREPDQVDEDDSDDPPLVPGRRDRLADREPAREAEAGDLGVLLAAGGANNHRQKPTAAGDKSRASSCGSGGHPVPRRREPWSRGERLMDDAVAQGEREQGVELLVRDVGLQVEA